MTITVAIEEASGNYSLDSYNASGEFYALWELKKGYLRLPERTNDVLIKFAEDNGFTINGRNIYK